MVIHFLLPAYNEAENIELQISKLFTIAKKLEFVGKVYVVNDGSTDPTEAKVAHLAKSNPSLILINHSVNGGPGKAFTTGYEYIIRVAAPEDAIISMDADNTHSEQTVQMMLARLQEGYELVIASVYATGGMFIGLPFIRYVLSLGCNMLYRILFPVAGIKEYTGFYRAVNVAALKKTMERFAEKSEPFISAHGFGCAAEMMVHFRRIPLFMTEVPMLVRYDKKGGKSKLRIGRTIQEHLGIISKNLFKRHVI